jgi:hypothetical protein
VGDRKSARRFKIKFKDASSFISKLICRNRRGVDLDMRSDIDRAPQGNDWADGLATL